MVCIESKKENWTTLHMVVLIRPGLGTGGLHLSHWDTMAAKVVFVKRQGKPLRFWQGLSERNCLTLCFP